MAPLQNAQTFYNSLKLRPNERRMLLLIGDILMASLAMMFALYFWARGDPYLDFSLEFVRRTPGWFFTLPLFWLILLSGLYQPHTAERWDETLRRIGVAAIVGLGFYMVIYFINEPSSLPRLGVAGFVGAAVILTLLWRLTYIRVFTAPRFLRRILVIGGGETGRMILRIIKEMVTQPFVTVGIVDDDPQKIGTEIEGFPVLGSSDQLLDLVTEHQVSDLIVAISGQMNGSMFQALLDAQEQGIEITRMPVAYEELLGRVPIRYLEADWILRSFVDETRTSIFYEMIKRIIDLAIGLVGLLAMIVLLPFIALAIYLDSGWPIFYTQVRLGRGGQHYQMIKFRTMRQDAEPDGQPRWAEENDRRATRVGLFLRKTHLDEIPQVINVLRGEMSLVGPRAERPELVDWFQNQVPFYRARLLVKPGITGWAQVNQAYAATVDETTLKLEYDLYYIKHRGLRTDMLVILRTPAMVLGLRGR